MFSDLTAIASLQTTPLLGAVSLTAESVFGPITNSIIVAVLVCALIVWFVRRAMKNPTLIPDGKQNVVEFFVEFLYNQVEGIVGRKVAPRAFPLLATMFVFILINNYFGLLPGIGTIGWEEVSVAAHEGAAAGHHDDHGHGRFTPWFRPGSADMNFTLALSIVFMLVWIYLTVRELGLWGFVVHTFGPKGGLTGIIKYGLIPIFIFVGLIEIVSISFRPVSLSLRLFGNIFAGETLLHAMGHLLEGMGAGPALAYLGKILLPLPFYFLELLVGVLQATVFTLLCAVYIQLSTSHDESHGEHEHGEGADHGPATAPAH